MLKFACIRQFRRFLRKEETIMAPNKVYGQPYEKGAAKNHFSGEPLRCAYICEEYEVAEGSTPP